MGRLIGRRTGRNLICGLGFLLASFASWGIGLYKINNPLSFEENLKQSTLYLDHKTGKRTIDRSVFYDCGVEYVYLGLGIPFASLALYNFLRAYSRIEKKFIEE